MSSPGRQNDWLGIEGTGEHTCMVVCRVLSPASHLPADPIPTVQAGCLYNCHRASESSEVGPGGLKHQETQTRLRSGGWAWETKVEAHAQDGGHCDSEGTPAPPTPGLWRGRDSSGHVHRCVFPGRRHLIQPGW